MNNEISESAKAIQEVAKATKTGIEATEKLGRFVSRITNEPIETIMGILNDRLQFMRWERRLRLVERAKEILDKRKIEGHIRIIPPKLALPIVENASLEENNELQDLWANLLASALDPNFTGTIRSAYIDIIKQLEVVDAHVLNVVYEEYKRESVENPKYTYFPNYGITKSPVEYAVPDSTIQERLQVESGVYENSIDNLIRVRCIAPYMFDQTTYEGADVELNFRYRYVCMTSFGVSFVEACCVQEDDNRIEKVSS